MRPLKLLLLLIVSLGLSSRRACALGEPSGNLEPKIKCHGWLAGATDLSGVMVAASAAMRGSAKDGAQLQLSLLRELLANPIYREALERKDLLAVLHIFGTVDVGASQHFYREAYDLVAAQPFSFSKTLLEYMDGFLLPHPCPEPESFPDEVFESEPVDRPDVNDSLDRLILHDPILTHQQFTGRIFAYMAEHPGLSRDAKFNFVIHLAAEFNRIKVRANPDAKLFIGTPYPEMSELGTRFICGKDDCEYFYAIEKGGAFYTAKKLNEFVRFSPNSWREDSIDIRQAVKQEWP